MEPSVIPNGLEVQDEPEMSMVDTVEKKNDMRQMSVVVSPSDVDGRQMIMVMELDPLPG